MGILFDRLTVNLWLQQSCRPAANAWLPLVFLGMMHVPGTWANAKAWAGGPHLSVVTLVCDWAQRAEPGCSPLHSGRPGLRLRPLLELRWACCCSIASLLELPHRRAWGTLGRPLNTWQRPAAHL